MVPANSFIPGKTSPWMQPHREALWEEWIIFHMCAPQSFFRLLFPCCFPQGCLLAFSPGARQCLCCPLKLQPLRPPGYKNSWKPAPLIFQVNGFGEMSSLCVSLCVLLSFALPWEHVFLHSTTSTICFLNSNSTKPTFFHMASSRPIVVEFVLSIFRMISGVFRIIL